MTVALTHAAVIQVKISFVWPMSKFEWIVFHRERKFIIASLAHYVAVHAICNLSKEIGGKIGLLFVWPCHVII